MPRIAVAVLALAALVVGAADASAAKPKPFKTHVGGSVEVKVKNFKPGIYTLSLVAKDRPARNAACLAKVAARTLIGKSGTATFKGKIPKRLHCYQGPNKSLGKIRTTAGAYRFVIGAKVDKAAWNPKKSFLRKAVRILG